MRIPVPLDRALLARALACALALACVAVPAAAQEPTLITGFGPAAAARQRALEQRLLGGIAPAELDSFSHALTREPHVAGSPAQARTRDRVLDCTRSWGLASEAKTYRVFLPWATAVSLELVAPERIQFTLSEEPVPGDSTTSLPQYPWANAYSAPGEVEAEVVYANYGLPEDYSLLDSLGVSVRGRVVIARYGRSFRGIKAQLAEQHGAAALLLYSDPGDDGYVRGDVYPDGLYRNPTAPQRGSILNADGDPTTPGWASTSGAKRLPPDNPAAALPRIPVMPLSYAVAGQILGRLGPAELPRQEWQGALPFRYHVGPGPARVHLRVQDDRTGPDRGMKDIWDTVARIPGSQRPDEWIVVGAHRDAWSTGANDNVSGVAAVMAAARAIAEQTRAGQRPKRTIVFATWDAEEWGLIGSVEWVEEMAKELGAKAVAYLNLDEVAGGDTFWAGAAPALKSFVRDVARSIPAPAGGGSIYERWSARATRTDAADGDVALGNLGGGSDFLWFYGNVGVPSATWGFGGGSGEYHSAYDSYPFLTRFADPGFVHHVATARLLAVAATRLANADVLPYDYSEAARELAARARRLRTQAVSTGGLADSRSFVGLEDAFRRMQIAADSLASVRDSFLGGNVDARRANSANQELLRVERSLLRPEGLQGRPWEHNLTVTSDITNGYANVMLPGVAEALAARDTAGASREAADLAAHVDAATAHLRAAARALEGK